MKKRISSEFLQNFRTICMDFLDIYCQNHPLLMRDFVVKCNNLESYLGFQTPISYYINDVGLFLKRFLNWIEKE